MFFYGALYTYIYTNRNRHFTTSILVVRNRGMGIYYEYTLNYEVNLVADMI